MARTIVNLHHRAPITLRIEERRAGEEGHLAFANGWGLMKQVGEIALVPGLNEIDADDWSRWMELNKDGPLMTGGHISVEKESDVEASASP